MKKAVGAMPETLAHLLPAPAGLRVVRTVVDVGAGVRPMQWYRAHRHLCIEPYGPYGDVLERMGYEVLRVTALDGLASLPAVSFDAVYLLDVIEHMEKLEGRGVLEHALRVAQCQVLVYTPYGFKEQSQDNWGYEGHEWQTHRSGWLPEDFPGWTISLYRGKPHKPVEGFYALWNRLSTAS